ncbi:hypothetical protein PHYBLDRAFT_163782 [Phycomyces blakesleeanus NRRL 1555(-)]|uniref:DDE Tnp4 domain-containing protein n=1 Tax=Phycomyces blakesleeanus (strain ATCC 8743b / DSM 1359 / FGSC 10004 / NBRC 33097 / NRRL 1555) TaxID=763407 RepID=A0A167PX36_PHYB8|nr:hypothetical protein PHYBLDRAFT_163782 [Phycomyces blakesleeanus NRRL 1555(-)]OAD78689.1 hypothetical protein PHYBLDRAFT_163782 [Phycomyces blakesleeanus NRRL 1555(-)]|eukprot:XP_018296729.1 hypothetical protein PHYBLDRAFT_163782 [Phycomyces blakesleeanus NRRL 1555(-)]
MGDIVYFREGTPSEFSLPIIQALMILLRGMVFPARSADLSLLFGKAKSTLSDIFHEMIEKIYFKFYSALRFDYCQFRESNLIRFSRAIRERSPAMNCVGFIDGTFNKMARSIVDQDGVYNGHSRGHGLKYQAVVTPDGITSSIMGPDSGRNHDVRLYHEGQLDGMMGEAFDFSSINGPCYYLYGDSAYTESDHMMIPYKRQTADEQEIAINKSMSDVRISVEHEFAHVGNLWGFLKYSQISDNVVKSNLTRKMETFISFYICQPGSETGLKFHFFRTRIFSNFGKFIQLSIILTCFWEQWIRPFNDTIYYNIFL